MITYSLKVHVSEIAKIVPFSESPGIFDKFASGIKTSNEVSEKKWKYLKHTILELLRISGIAPG
jgi:hypothetical protein